MNNNLKKNQITISRKKYNSLKNLYLKKKIYNILIKNNFIYFFFYNIFLKTDLFNLQKQLNLFNLKAFCLKKNYFKNFKKNNNFLFLNNLTTNNILIIYSIKNAELTNEITKIIAELNPKLFFLSGFLLNKFFFRPSEFKFFFNKSINLINLKNIETKQIIFSILLLKNLLKKNLSLKNN